MKLGIFDLLFQLTFHVNHYDKFVRYQRQFRMETYEAMELKIDLCDGFATHIFKLKKDLLRKIGHPTGGVSWDEAEQCLQSLQATNPRLKFELELLVVDKIDYFKDFLESLYEVKTVCISDLRCYLLQVHDKLQSLLPIGQSVKRVIKALNKSKEYNGWMPMRQEVDFYMKNRISDTVFRL